MNFDSEALTHLNQGVDELQQREGSVRQTVRGRGSVGRVVAELLVLYPNAAG
jgi:hypothetical protein